VRAAQCSWRATTAGLATWRPGEPALGRGRPGGGLKPWPGSPGRRGRGGARAPARTTTSPVDPSRPSSARARSRISPSTTCAAAQPRLFRRDAPLLATHACMPPARQLRRGCARPRCAPCRTAAQPRCIVQRAACFSAFTFDRECLEQPMTVMGPLKSEPRNDLLSPTTYLPSGLRTLASHRISSQQQRARGNASTQDGDPTHRERPRNSAGHGRALGLHRARRRARLAAALVEGGIAGEHRMEPAARDTRTTCACMQGTLQPDSAA